MIPDFFYLTQFPDTPFEWRKTYFLPLLWSFGPHHMQLRAVLWQQRRRENLWFVWEGESR